MSICVTNLGSQSKAFNLIIHMYHYSSSYLWVNIGCALVITFQVHSFNVPSRDRLPFMGAFLGVPIVFRLHNLASSILALKLVWPPQGPSSRIIKRLRLRRILGKSFWSSCVRFTFADLLTNAVLEPTLLIHTSLVAESWIFQFTHNLP